MDWFFYIIIATVLYGVYNFIYKLATSKGISSSQIVNKAAISVSILSFLTILILGSEFVDIELILFFALLNSSAFALGAVCKVKALSYIPTSYVFPIGKMNAFLVIILSIVFLGDRPTINQYIGFLFILLMMLILFWDVFDNRKNSNYKNVKLGIMLASVSAIATAGSMFVGKFASTSVTILNYIFVSYSMVAIYTYLIPKFINRNTLLEKTSKSVYFYGFAAGLLNFIGYYLVLKAFACGPLSLIQGISATALAIPIFLSIVFLKESFNLKKGLIVLFALIAIILIKI
ncbi:MAG: EamA family transporter [Pseudomonadota bacterium]